MYTIAETSLSLGNKKGSRVWPCEIIINVVVCCAQTCGEGNNNFLLQFIEYTTVAILFIDN
jgi:hypothetical protein